MPRVAKKHFAYSRKGKAAAKAEAAKTGKRVTHENSAYADRLVALLVEKKGWIKQAAASIERRGTEGKCTPITKPECTGRAKALAKTFKKIGRKRDREIVSKKERASRK